MHCGMYSDVRNKFLTEISHIGKNFDDLDVENKFIWLMSNEDRDVINKTAAYIQQCFMIRNGGCR